MKRSYFYLLLVLSGPLFGRGFSLPSSMDSKAVYYCSSEQLDKFCCGYNVLFNACNLENNCGRHNPFGRYDTFESMINACLRVKGVKPMPSVRTDLIEELATKKLGLRNFFVLSFNKGCGRLEFFRGEAVEVWHNSGASQAEIDRLFQKAWKKRTGECFQEIKQQLLSWQPAVIHFLCDVTIDGTGHGILVSLVQNSSGRGLYIFDNMNEVINDNSEILTYVNRLVSEFDISPRQHYWGPTIPDRWSSLQGRR